MFELNPDRKTFIDNVNGRTVIIIDDFYKNPDEVRNLALTSERRRDPSLINGLPGSRVFIETDELKKNVKPFFDELCLSDIWRTNIDQKMYEFQWDAVGFMVNIMDHDSVMEWPFLSVPHQDRYANDIGTDVTQFGVVVYLNTPEECQGGTNLYSYKNNMSVPYNSLEYIDKPEGFDEKCKRPEDLFPYIMNWLQGDKEWRVEYEAKMVYNRCVFYESDVLHAAHLDVGMFTEHERVNQVFFL